jgi:hypothetical protein
MKHVKLIITNTYDCKIGVRFLLLVPHSFEFYTTYKNEASKETDREREREREEKI